MKPVKKLPYAKFYLGEIGNSYVFSDNAYNKETFTASFTNNFMPAASDAVDANAYLRYPIQILGANTDQNFHLSGGSTAGPYNSQVGGVSKNNGMCFNAIHWWMNPNKFEQISTSVRDQQDPNVYYTVGGHTNTIVKSDETGSCIKVQNRGETSSAGPSIVVDLGLPYIWQGYSASTYFYFGSRWNKDGMNMMNDNPVSWRGSPATVFAIVGSKIFFFRNYNNTHYIESLDMSNNSLTVLYSVALDGYSYTCKGASEAVEYEPGKHRFYVTAGRRAEEGLDTANTPNCQIDFCQFEVDVNAGTVDEYRITPDYATAGVEELEVTRQYTDPSYGYSEKTFITEDSGNKYLHVVFTDNSNMIHNGININGVIADTYAIRTYLLDEVNKTATYLYRKSVYNEIFCCMPLSGDNKKMLILTRSATMTLSWTAINGWEIGTNYPMITTHALFDTQGRLMLMNTQRELFIIMPGVPATVDIEWEQEQYSFLGTPINTSFGLSIYNFDGARISVEGDLKINSSNAEFDDGSKIKVGLATSSSATVNVPVVITGPGVVSILFDVDITL